MSCAIHRLFRTKVSRKLKSRVMTSEGQWVMKSLSENIVLFQSNVAEEIREFTVKILSLGVCVTVGRKLVGCHLSIHL